MTCRPLLVQTRDVLRPGVVLWMAWCPQCRWDSDESENETVARARLAAHNNNKGSE